MANLKQIGLLMDDGTGIVIGVEELLDLEVLLSRPIDPDVFAGGQPPQDFVPPADIAEVRFTCKINRNEWTDFTEPMPGKVTEISQNRLPDGRVENEEV